jgi:catechol 2,3-dioxygenase-like lactoylglutathione lyase family enzyme
MIDHIGFSVRDFPRSRDFYRTALAPLGIAVLREGEGWAALGGDGHTEFWIGVFGTPPGPVHLAFHAAAIAAGGKDNGGPGVRAQYHPHYYAAFVFDPDGHNIEAVCHAPEP